MTNFEKIKQMTVEEMVEYFSNVFCLLLSECKYKDCSECIKNWLNKEAEQ